MARGSSLSSVGRFGWGVGRIKNQFIRLPKVMAAKAKEIIGIDILKSSLCGLFRGRELGGCHRSLITRRVE